MFIDSLIPKKTNVLSLRIWQIFLNVHFQGEKQKGKYCTIDSIKWQNWECCSQTQKLEPRKLIAWLRLRDSRARKGEVQDRELEHFQG